jgi:hypothetical protein
MSSLDRIDFMIGLRHNIFLVVIAFLSLAMVPGCGDGKPYTDTSLNEATVSGVVTAKGEAVTAGTISFNAANSGRLVPARTAEIGPDGHYTLKTYTGDNQVTYGGEVAKKHMGVGLRKDFATVQSGENTFDFDVLGAGAKSLPVDFSKKPNRPKKR